MVRLTPAGRVDAPDPQMQKLMVEVVLDIPQERVQQRTTEHIIDVSMPQAVEEMVERTREQITAGPGKYSSPNSLFGHLCLDLEFPREPPEKYFGVLIVHRFIADDHHHNHQ